MVLRDFQNIDAFIFSGGDVSNFHREKEPKTKICFCVDQSSF